MDLMTGSGTDPEGRHEWQERWKTSTPRERRVMLREHMRRYRESDEARSRTRSMHRMGWAYLLVLVVVALFSFAVVLLR